MTLTIENFDGAPALNDVQSLQAAAGTGWLSGCGASLNSTDQAIRIDIASGQVTVENTTYGLNAQSIDLPDGDAQNPRKDIVYVDDSGQLQSAQGEPRAPKDGTPTPGTDRSVYQPEPPDLADVSGGFTAACPLAEIWVPVGASGASDMDDSSITYVRDRRRRPWAADVLTSGDEYTDEEAQDAVGAIATNGLAYDDANDELGLDVVEDSTVTLSSGEATIDTGNAVGDGFDYTILFGDTDGAEVGAEKGESGGNHTITIEETDTSIGNPTVSYTIVRV